MYAEIILNRVIRKGLTEKMTFKKASRSEKITMWEEKPSK